MARDRIPTTPAIRQLRDAKVTFTPHPYNYRDRGGAAHSARELDIELHAVIKTIVLSDNDNNLYLILMHGDLEVSTKLLARTSRVRSLDPATSTQAKRATGYQFGGTSPFGIRQDLPCFAEETILDLDLLYINGGAKGLLVSMKPEELDRVLQPQWVAAAQDR